MRDKITILLLVLMVLWFLGSWVVVPIMKANRPGGPALAIDDVSDRNYLPPFVWPDAETLEVSIREVVYGPLVTQTYTQDAIPGTRTINNSGPREVLEATSGQPIALSDGRELNIRAYRIIPVVHDAGMQSYPISGEVFVLPNGDIASEDEQKKLAEDFELGGRGLNASETAGIPGFLIQVLLEVNFEWISLSNFELRDSLAGARTSNSRGMSSISGSLLESRIALDFAHNGIRPAPLIFKVDLWFKEADPFKFGLSAPQTFEISGHDITLISVQSFNQERVELTTLSGEDLPHEFTNRTWDHTRVTFDQMPDGFIGLEALLTSGETSNALARYGNEFRIRHPFEEIETLQLDVGTGQLRVVIHLPDLPIYPEQNRDLRDVRKMIFPTPTIISSRQHTENLLATILQTYGGGEIPERFYGPSYPWDVSGWTVDRFLDTTFARYEFLSIIEHDFVMNIHDRGFSSWDVRSVGETRRRYRPFLARFYDLIQRNDVPLAFFLGLIALRQGWITMRSNQLLRHLRNIGYTTFGLWDADRLNRALGKGAWRIPSHDELGSIPEVDAQSAASIILVMRKRLKRRD